MRSGCKIITFFTILLSTLFPCLSHAFEPTPQQIQEAEQFRQLYPPLLNSLMGAIQTSPESEVKTQMGNLSTNYTAEQMEDLKCFTEGHLNFVKNEPIENLARFLSDNTFSKEIFSRIANECNSVWLQEQVGQGFLLFGM